MTKAAAPSQPSSGAASRSSWNEHAIWLYALGYFLAYVPYGWLTKGLSSGGLPGASEPLAGLAILPISTAVSAIGMLAFLGLSGLWRSASRRVVWGVAWPVPRPTTLASGACTAAIVVTTTLAYTFEGTSIVAMMLMMRGGVLVIAPLVDRWSGRRVRWYSWVALALSAAALGHALIDALGARVASLALVDVAIYLAAYFVRLRAMSRLAKGAAGANRAFFVEEQLVATPLALAVIAAGALLAPGALGRVLTEGFVEVPASGALGWVVMVGLLSQATGIFGALVLLDARENAFSVPVNRASSVLAGVVASAAVHVTLGGPALDRGELGGAALLVLAIAVLALGPRVTSPRRS